MGQERASDKDHDIELERLASIVAFSDDAIISKSLDGIIRTWNAGATQIFGYTAEEIIGQSVYRLIPPDLHDQEVEILSKLRRGESIKHFDTIRVAKDGRLVDISLTVSPLRNQAGEVVGASKIARDVTERKRAEAMQRLLIDELNHRVKNTLAIVQSVASQSLAFADSPEDFLASFGGRLQTLSRAHDLLVRERMQGISLRDLVASQISSDAELDSSITLSGPDVTLRGTLVTHLALILHELTTNARKFGALSLDQGRLSLSWYRAASAADRLVLVWSESGVPSVSEPERPGFGTQLIQKTLDASGGNATMTYRPDGLEARLEFRVQDKEDIGEAPSEGPKPTEDAPGAAIDSFDGLKALLVEDEAIVAMDLEFKFEQLGFDVVGTAASVTEALDILSKTEPDLVLLDANLHGERVDKVAAALAQRSIPFAFATGYGRETLPEGFREMELLSKPYSDARLVNVLSRLAGLAIAAR